MHSDRLSPVLQIVQNADAAKRNSKMSLLKSLSREGLEEMATTSADSGIVLINETPSDPNRQNHCVPGGDGGELGSRYPNSSLVTIEAKSGA